MINSGQVCNCAERIYVQREVKEAFTEKLVELMKKVRFGDPLADESLDMGPMVNLQGQQHAQKMVDETIKAGSCLAEKLFKVKGIILSQQSLLM